MFDECKGCACLETCPTACQPGSLLCMSKRMSSKQTKAQQMRAAGEYRPIVGSRYSCNICGQPLRSRGMVNQEKMKELDSHWKDVMDLAEQYGFIGQAAGGTAILLTHKNQLEADGEEKYIYRQRSLFGIEMGDGNESNSKVSGK